MKYIADRLNSLQTTINGHQEESDNDSAYQIALEFGGGLYCGHPTDRAKLRNFRKCKCLLTL